VDVHLEDGTLRHMTVPEFFLYCRDNGLGFDVLTSHGVSTSQHDHSARVQRGRSEGSAQADRAAGNANHQPQDASPIAAGGRQGQESEGETPDTDYMRRCEEDYLDAVKTLRRAWDNASKAHEVLKAVRTEADA
jgi:hypothetical protein